MTEKKKIAYQGVSGSFSSIVAKEIFSYDELRAFPSFSETLRAVKEMDFNYAILPVENSEAGRVADLHMLLPNSGLFIVGEHYKRIEHNLLGISKSSLSDIKKVYSHPHALVQCSRKIKEMGIEAVAFSNTAAAAKEIAKINNKELGAIASLDAAKNYGLNILLENVENSNNNTTRFLIIAKNIEVPVFSENTKTITSLYFMLKNTPASLYNALGSFALNNINMTRIESCIGSFISAAFVVDIEAHIESPQFKKALEDLKNKVKEIKILGAYQANSYRFKE